MRQLAATLFALGDLDKAFYYLNRCVDKRMGAAAFYLEYPAYRGIKDAPRYFALKQRQELAN